MNRVVYIPSKDFLNEGERLASIWNLTILEGESERTKDLEFDRTKVCILSIPTAKTFSITSGLFVTGSCITFRYLDEYNFCNGMTLRIESHNYKKDFTPIYAERHYVNFKARIPIAGRYEAIIMRDGIMVDKSFFEITEDING
jgi:hypothetical protein